MTEPTEHSEDRIAVAIDRGTRIVRLLTWAAMFVLVCLMLWVVSGMAAKAEDPKAAARAIGNAGAAAAGAIARDAASTGKVPGYAGTDVPERNLTASGMEDAARARLADPDDPGGAAGQAVVRGTTSRPAQNVPAGDPMVRRSETVAASPQSSVHRADGIASGGATACGADLQDAQAGGSCGSVRYCVGAGCETVPSQANTGFVNATTRLNMALELGGDEFDRQDMRFFKGTRRACHIHFGGLADCCKNSGALVGLANCSASEIELARSATPATPTISAGTARGRPSSASASGIRGPGACSARSSGASCSSRAGASSASAGRAAGASRWRRSRASTSPAWTFPSSPRT